MVYICHLNNLNYIMSNAKKWQGFKKAFPETSLKC